MIYKDRPPMVPVGPPRDVSPVPSSDQLVGMVKLCLETCTNLTQRLDQFEKQMIAQLASDIEETKKATKRLKAVNAIDPETYTNIMCAHFGLPRGGPKSRVETAPKKSDTFRSRLLKTLDWFLYK